MNRIEIIKNRLDLEFRQKLQEHATILNARWSLPFATGAAFFTKFPDISFGGVWGTVTALLIFLYINNFMADSEQDLDNIKQQIKSLA
jgi:hypothetical protein